MIDSLACALVRLTSSFLCWLSPTHSVWLGQKIGLFAFWISTKRRQIGERNLRAAFDGQEITSDTRRIIRQCFTNLGSSAVEFMRLPALDKSYMEKHISIEGYERFQEVHALGKSVIWITAHYGNWELSSIVTALKGDPIVALARFQNNLPKLYALLVSYRESKGATVVHKGGAMRKLLLALEQGRSVGIVADQASRQGIFVDFFGRQALFATGAFNLAYDKQAVLLPAFIHRVQGPYHRIKVEEPIELSRILPKPEAIRKGVEQFSAILARHIKDDPSQWLWMHKRWKHTPARRLLVLSDGKAGHLKQSLALVEALKERLKEQKKDVLHQIVEIRYRNRFCRSLVSLWSGWMPFSWGRTVLLSRTLQPQSAKMLLSHYADGIISCGSQTAPVNVLWAAENNAKSVVIMNPAPVPLSRFDLVIVPKHDSLPRRANVVEIAGALSCIRDKDLLEASRKLTTHPRFRVPRTSDSKRNPSMVSEKMQASPTLAPVSTVISVFIGGDTPDYCVSESFVNVLIEQVQRVCERLGGYYLITTSRRTPVSIERMLQERVEREARCGLLIIASRDPWEGAMEGMLGLSALSVVTGESISMVSEACASERQVVVVEPPSRSLRVVGSTKQHRFLLNLVSDGFIRLHPLPELSHAITQALTNPRQIRRWDSFTQAQEAVARLF